MSYEVDVYTLGIELYLLVGVLQLGLEFGQVPLHRLEVVGVLISTGCQYSKVFLGLLYLFLKPGYGLGCITHLLREVGYVTGVDFYMDSGNLF